MKNSIFKISLLFFFLAGLITCTNDKGVPDYNDYPEEIGKLIFTKCATSGCHNTASKEAAGGLSLQSWNDLFAGGRGGAAVIPYRSDYSTLFYFTNTFSDLGPTLRPTMPYNKPPLSREEVLMLKSWIDAGAPDREGFVKFSDNPNRKKYYVTNQGCDVVTVFDQASGLQMRYIDVGQTAGTDIPHMIRVSPDKQYWYVLSVTGLYLEKFRASDDRFVAKAFIGIGNWNAFTISSDSQTAYCTDLSAPAGKVSTVDLTSMTASPQQPFNYPHGVALKASDDTMYITQQAGSRLYKVPVADFSALSQVDLFTGPDPAITLNPHEIVFSPDGSKYFVTCQGSEEVRIFQSGSDALLGIIPVGASPTEMAFSTNTPYMFVSCTEDTINFPGKRGSVAVINYQTNSFVKYIYTGHQPHGIAVDDVKKIVVVANRNFATDGPSPHHSGACGGRNGFVSFININTLNMVPVSVGSSTKKIEISVDPYSVGIR
jgi:DNA-binding beta-propeller fold protein YncE